MSFCLFISLADTIPNWKHFMCLQMAWFLRAEQAMLYAGTKNPVFLGKLRRSCNFFDRQKLAPPPTSLFSKWIAKPRTTGQEFMSDVFVAFNEHSLKSALKYQTLKIPGLTRHYGSRVLISVFRIYKNQIFKNLWFREN